MYNLNLKGNIYLRLKCSSHSITNVSNCSVILIHRLITKCVHKLSIVIIITVRFTISNIYHLFGGAYLISVPVSPIRTTSSVQGQKPHPHHPAQPPRAFDRRGRGLHRLHPPYAVHRPRRRAAHHAVRGDAHLAPPRRQMAEHSLPPLRVAHRPCQVR